MSVQSLSGSYYFPIINFGGFTTGSAGNFAYVEGPNMTKYSKDNLPTLEAPLKPNDRVIFTIKGEEYVGIVNDNHIGIGCTNDIVFQKAGLNEEEKQEFVAMIYERPKFTGCWPVPKDLGNLKEVMRALTKLVILMLKEEEFLKAVKDWKKDKKKVKREALEKKIKACEDAVKKVTPQNKEVMSFLVENPEMFRDVRQDVNALMCALAGIPNDEEIMKAVSK